MPETSPSTARLRGEFGYPSLEYCPSACVASRHERKLLASAASRLGYNSSAGARPVSLRRVGVGRIKQNRRRAAPARLRARLARPRPPPLGRRRAPGRNIFLPPPPAVAAWFSP